MLRRLTVDELLAVRRAIAAGTRHTQIARRMGLSVWTIDRIAVDWRFDADPINDQDLPVDDAPANYDAENLRRCPGCGGVVSVWPRVGRERAGKGRGAAAEEVGEEEREGAGEGARG